MNTVLHRVTFEPTAEEYKEENYVILGVFCLGRGSVNVQAWKHMRCTIRESVCFERYE